MEGNDGGRGQQIDTAYSEVLIASGCLTNGGSGSNLTTNFLKDMIRKSLAAGAHDFPGHPVVLFELWIANNLLGGNLDHDLVVSGNKRVFIYHFS
jgi:hypothetical protein